MLQAHWGGQFLQHFVFRHMSLKLSRAALERIT
jgi:hypothetical protein